MLLSIWKETMFLPSLQLPWPHHRGHWNRTLIGDEHQAALVPTIKKFFYFLINVILIDFIANFHSFQRYINTKF